MRLYFRSRNDHQLRGKSLTEVEDCQPYETITDEFNKTWPIAPCGAVANSLFNDTFELFYQQGDNITKVPWTTKGLLDPRIKEKYINPPPIDGSLCKAFKNTLSPPAWSKRTCELDDGEGGLGFENFDFMVWMQTAALPKFRKVYRGLNRSSDELFKDGLPKGSYILKISYSKLFDIKLK